MGRPQSGRRLAYLKALFALALLLAGGIPWLPEPFGEAQANTLAPWWGTVDRADPGSGWHMRVALKVENPSTKESYRNPVVEAELDFNDLLRDAGWTATGAADGGRITGFTLDEDSLRLVEYTPEWAGIRGAGTPIPVRFTPGYHRGENLDPYNATNNPHGTVTWVVPDTLAPLAARYYFLYFDALENGKKAPLAGNPADLALVAARTSSGPATTFYGRELGAPAGSGRWDIIGLHDLTTVTVYDMSSGIPIRHTPAPIYQNPMLVNETQVRSYSFTSEAPFKIVASRPVLIASHGDVKVSGNVAVVRSYETTAFVPSIDKGYAGRSFIFPPYATRLFLYSAGSVVSSIEMSCPNLLSPPTSVPAEGYVVVEPIRVDTGLHPDPCRIEVKSGSDILVQYGGTGAGMVQVPSLEGTAAGPVLHAFVPLSANTVVSALGGAAKARVIDLDTGRQVEPEPGVVSVSRTKAKDVGPTLANAWTLGDVDTFPDHPVQFWSSTLEDPAAPQRPLAVLAGTGTPVTPFLSLDGRTFHVQGKFQASAYYNGTTLTVVKYKDRDGWVPQWANFTLFEDGAVTDADLFRSGDAEARYLVLSNKPVSVVPATVEPHYGRFLNGVAAYPLSVTVHGAEYIGSLVSLAPVANQAEPLVEVTGVNQSVTFRALLENRGRWLRGEGLRETFTLEPVLDARNPAAWEVVVSHATVTLNSNEPLEVSVTVIPLAAAGSGDSARVTLLARSTLNPQMEDRLATVTLVENTYGVRLSFGGGACLLGSKRCEQGVDNVQAFRYTVVIQNVGSVPDTFNLSRTEPPPGWTTEIRRGSEKLTKITLKPRELAFVDLVGVSPAPGVASPASDVELTAVSQNDSSKADKVFTTTRVNPKVDVTLAAETVIENILPGSTARFNLTVGNRGNDLFTYAFSVDGFLPAGWTARLEDPAGGHLTEIVLGPGDLFNFSLELTAGTTAPAGELYSQKVAVDVYGSTSASVIATRQLVLTAKVQQVHNITVEAVGDLRLRPGAPAPVTLLLKNHGNGNEYLSVRPGSIPVGWTGPTGGQNVLVPPGGEARTTITFTIPTHHENGTYPLGLRLVAADGYETRLDKTVTLLGTAALELTGPATLATSANTDRTLTFTLANTGNIRLNASLRVEFPGATPGAGWIGTATPARVELRPRDTIPFTVTLRAPIGTAPGDYAVRVVAEPLLPEKPPATVANLELQVRRPDLVLTGAITQEGRGVTEGLTLVSATVRNEGDIEARDIRVGLYVGGRRVDNVTLGLLAPQQSAIATLKLPHGETGATYQVVVDPDAGLDETDEENNAFSVSAPPQTPGPGLLAALAALGLAGLLLRRRGPFGGER